MAGRYDRRIDKRPRPYVPGGIKVSVKGAATVFTEKFGLALAVCFLAMSAYGTGTTCVPRAYEQDRNSCKFCFVLDISSQLTERPSGLPRSLFTPDRCPLTNALKVLKRKSATGAFSPRNEQFGYSVVYVFSETGLPVAHLFQVPFCRPRSSGLQASPESGVALPDLFYNLAGVNVIVAVGRNVNNPKVNSEIIHGGLRDCPGNIAGCHQKPLARSKDEVGFAPAALKHFGLSFAADIGNPLSAGDRPDGNAPVTFEREDPAVESRSATGFKHSQDLLILVVSVGNFGKEADYSLGAKAELFLHLVVHKSVQGILVERLALESLCGHIVTGKVDLFKGAQERIRLSRGRLQSDLCGKLHTLSILRSWGLSTTNWKGAALHPRTKVRGVRADQL